VELAVAVNAYVTQPEEAKFRARGRPTKPHPAIRTDLGIRNFTTNAFSPQSRGGYCQLSVAVSFMMSHFENRHSVESLNRTIAVPD
jgi:hypothetical protein